MNVVPTGRRVLVKQDEAETEIGSIVLPKGSEKAPPTGTVVAVGEECKYRKDGERVVFLEFASTEVSAAADEPGLILLDEDDIIAVMTK